MCEGGDSMLNMVNNGEGRVLKMGLELFKKAVLGN